MCGLCGQNTSDVARARGTFRDGYVQGLLADPDAELAGSRGNELWQPGLLEPWLQSHGN